MKTPHITLVLGAASGRPFSPGRWSPLAQRLVLLLAISALACVSTLAGRGVVAAAALLCAVLAGSATLLAAPALGLKRRRAADAVPGARARAGTAKAVLVLTMCTGLAAYFGGAGTFAGFTAETGNPGGAIASGTLTMNDTVDGGTVCMSIGGASANNVNAGCDALVSLDNQEPGLSGVAKITIRNTGSLDASGLWFGASYVNGELGADLAPGTITSMTLAPPGLEGPVASGDTIEVSSGPDVVDFVASANASPGATTISVSSQSIADTLAAGATVVDTSSDTTAGVNTDCYDQRTTQPGGGVTGATKGTDLNFNPTTNNPLCAAMLIWVQEVGANDYCWYGNTTNAPAGACDAPVYADLPSGETIDSTTTSIPLGSLNGNVAQNDTILVTEGATQSSCTASAAVYITSAATSIPVGACTPAGGNTFTTAAVVTDSTTLTSLNADTTHTITKFDTATQPASRIELTPVSANGVTAPTGVDLPHYDGGSTDTRTFYVGVYFPQKAAQQNPLQGLMSTFGVTWHINQ